MAQNVNCFVLAGGRSSRMGRDKALLTWNGRPLVEHALDRFRRLGWEPRIVGQRPDLARFAPVIEDNFPGSGPLAGIEAALSVSGSAWNLFVPVDLPLLPADFLRWIAARARLTEAAATIPQVQGCAQPLVAVYHRTLAAGLRASLRRGDGKVMLAVEDAARAAGIGIDRFDVESVAAIQIPDEPGTVRLPVHRWFDNLNAPADLARVSLEQMPAIH